jgi:hypothetical protein
MLPDNPHTLSFDVGIDCHNYYPLEFAQVKEIMSKKLWRPIDAHGLVKQVGGGYGLTREDYEKRERYRLYLQLKEEFESQVKVVGLNPPPTEVVFTSTAQLDAQDENKRNI